jgi:hypothetical protein
MKNIRCIVLLAVFSCLFQLAKAQDEEPQTKGFDKSKLFFGGNFGASFGSYTFINVSPQVGYQFNKYFAAGLGVNLIYSSLRYDDAYGNTLYKDKSGYTGLALFARAFPVRFLYLQVQPEYNYTWWTREYSNGYPSDKFNGFVPSVLVGGGVAIPTGQRGAFLVGVSYDLVQDPRSPYGNGMFLNFGYSF